MQIARLTPIFARPRTGGLHKGQKMSESPALLLLPNLLGEHKFHQIFLPMSVDKAVLSIDGLIAESEKEGRRYLKRFETKKPAQEIPIALFNEHTPDEDLDFLLEPILKGDAMGNCFRCRSSLCGRSRI